MLPLDLQNAASTPLNSSFCSTLSLFLYIRWGVADLAAVQRPIRELAHADPTSGKLVRGSPGYPQLPRCVAEALWSDPTHSDADAHKVPEKRGP